MKGHIIALDAMGGDNAPDAIVAGGVAALRKYPDISLILAGPEAKLNGLISGAVSQRELRSFAFLCPSKTASV